MQEDSHVNQFLIALLKRRKEKQRRSHTAKVLIDI